MLTNDALMAMRNHFKDHIAYARFRIGDGYLNAEISDASILEDGRISICFMIDPAQEGTETITQVQLLDQEDVVWASMTENIKRTALQQGILYRFFVLIGEQ